MSTPRVTVRQIGREREPVAVIEGLARDPDALRAAATETAFAPAANAYPGLRAPPPPGYIGEVWPLLAAVMADVFGAHGKMSVLDAGFALVTSAPATLTVEQRLPHIDAVLPGRLALVHFLVPGRTAGTAFYRHRATGHETIDPSRADGYYRTLAAELERAELPAGYLQGDTPLFEQVDAFEGCYNRALVYRSHCLHCGLIAPGMALSDDPRRGRLTITGFFALR